MAYAHKLRQPILQGDGRHAVGRPLWRTRESPRTSAQKTCRSSNRTRTWRSSPTRRHRFPVKVLDAYATYSYDGNLLDLMDPVHSDLFAPRIVDNKAFPHDFAETVGACPHANDCRHCGRCAEVLAKVLR